VVGFDGISMAGYANPPLTTVVQDTSKAGDLLVQALLQLVREQPAESVMLQPTLDVRASSGG
jgi:DNA-binding LacI/PurR family transcriptional regulator